MPQPTPDFPPPNVTRAVWRATTVAADHTIRAAFKDEAGKTIILALQPLEAMKLAGSICEMTGGFFDEHVSYAQPQRTAQG